MDKSKFGSEQDNNSSENSPQSVLGEMIGSNAYDNKAGSLSQGGQFPGEVSHYPGAHRSLEEKTQAAAYNVEPSDDSFAVNIEDLPTQTLSNVKIPAAYTNLEPAPAPDYSQEDESQSQIPDEISDESTVAGLNNKGEVVSFSSSKNNSWRRIPTAKRLISFTALMSVLGLICLACGLLYIKNMPNETSNSDGILPEVLNAFGNYSAEPVFAGRDRLNILCLGIDFNRDEKGIAYTTGARSDTIFVVSIDSKGKTLNVLSVPRDTQVYINEEYGYDKINSAYMHGGIELTKKVVSEFLGVPIHHYVIVKVAGAFKLVDALGGLQLDVEKDMDYDDNWGNLHIHLRKGEQLLNGEQAVGYARFRMDAESDRGRIRRQQQIMMALIKRIKEPMVVLRLQSIVKAVKENVETDLSLLELLDLTYLYKDFDRKQMKTGAIIGDDTDINGVSYIIPFVAENEKIIMELLKSPSNLKRHDVRVEIINASGEENLAGKIAEKLLAEDFQVVKMSTAEGVNDTTTVVDHLGSTAIRSVLESILLGANYELDGELTTGNNVDITIILGLDRTDSYQPKYEEPYQEPMGSAGSAEDPPSVRSDYSTEDSYSSDVHVETELQPSEPGSYHDSPGNYPQDSSSDSGYSEVPVEKPLPAPIEEVPVSPAEPYNEVPVESAPEPSVETPVTLPTESTEVEMQ